MKVRGPRTAQLVGWSLAALLLAAVAVPGAAAGSVARSGVAGPTALTASPATAIAEPGTKYYIVGQPVDGQREYLFDIAAKTLHDASRYLDIFTLNKNRIQPDGGVLTDPTVLEPGWILVLPADADGPGVLTGPLPTAVESIPIPAVPPTGPLAEAAGATDRGAGQATAVRLMALLAMTGLLAFALSALRRGRLARVAGHAEADLAEADEDVAVRATVVESGRRLGRAISPARIMARSPQADVAADTALAPPSVPASSPVRPVRPAPYRPSATEPRSAPEPPRVARPASVALDTESARVPSMAAATAVSGPATTVDLPDSLRTHSLQTVLDSSGHDVTVSLAGARPPRSSPPFTWLSRGQALPVPTAVVLGSGERGRLCVDMAFAPDALTVGGPAAACQSIAVDLATQLRRAGVSVTVVGGALGSAAPAGCRQVETLAEVDDGAPTSLDVVFCAGRHAGDPTAVHRLLAHTSRRIVPVILGTGPRARWSIRVEGPLRPAAGVDTGPV